MVVVVTVEKEESKKAGLTWEGSWGGASSFGERETGRKERRTETKGNKRQDTEHDVLTSVLLALHTSVCVCVCVHVCVYLQERTGNLVFAGFSEVSETWGKFWM